MEGSAILIRDIQGLKTPSDIQGQNSGIGGVMKGLVRDLLHQPPQKDDVHVLRGELVFSQEREDGWQGDDDQKRTPFHLLRDPQITVFCNAQDIAPLNHTEFQLLAGIKSPQARHKVFIDDGLDWGSQLVVGSRVSVVLPSSNLSVPTVAVAVVRYVGAFPDELGLKFGVEIMEAEHKGKGSTNGFFREKDYFRCEEDCGLFVSLDKIHPIPKAGGLPHGSVHASQSPTQSLVTVDQPPAVQVGDRVVLNNKRGVACHGEVKWMGTESASRKFGYPVVGMVMDDELSYMDFEGVVPGITHLISGSKKNNLLFMPASLVSVDQRKLELSATTAQPQAEVEPIDLPPPIWAPPEEKANPVHSNLPSHPFRHPPPSQPPGNSPPASLSVGSAIQLVQDPSRTGVIRWTGYLPGAPLLIAGVELDRPMDGCGDGEWRGVRYFTCQQGRAFFCPVNNITAIYTQTEGQKKQVQENLEAENRSLRQQIEQLKSDHQAQVNQLHREIGEKDQANANLQQQLAQELERSQSLQEQLARANTEQMRPATQLLKNVKFNMVKRSEVSKQANIGEGAWGVVARGTLGGRAVAVKCPHVALLKQFPKVMDRLRREVAIMAQVRHPNLVCFIAAVFDEAAEQLRESPMIITELLDTNLRSAYQEGRVQRTDYLTILRDIAYALHYLHGLQQPIIHRDVSSPNVLLQKQPSGGWLAKVSDFGSANLAKLAYTAGEGAIIYTAPEAFPDIASDTDTEPPPMTTKIDVYSYGVVVCELIVGEMPVPERYRAMLQQVKGKWPAMHSLIVRCTKRNPLDRPTMADILDELSQHSR